MARVPLIPESDGARDPALAPLYADAAGRRGSVLNLYQVIANQPPALGAHLTMSRYVRDDSSMPPDLRELAILGTAFGLDSRYEQIHHIRAGRAAGISDEKLAAFPDWAAYPGFSETERDVLRFADELARTRTVTQATFDAAIARFGRAGAMDLLVTCAFYHYCAAIIGAVELDIE